MNGAAPQLTNSMDSILVDGVLGMTGLDLQKRFPSRMLGGPSLQLGIPIERLRIPPGIG